MTHVSLSASQEEKLFEDFVEGICLDELEISRNIAPQMARRAPNFTPVDAAVTALLQPPDRIWHKVLVSTSGASTTIRSLGTKAVLAGDHEFAGH